MKTKFETNVKASLSLSFVFPTCRCWLEPPPPNISHRTPFPHPPTSSCSTTIYEMAAPTNETTNNQHTTTFGNFITQTQPTTTDDNDITKRNLAYQRHHSVHTNTQCIQQGMLT